MAAQTLPGRDGGAGALPSPLMASAVQLVDRRVDRTQRGGPGGAVGAGGQPIFDATLQESPPLAWGAQPSQTRPLEGPPFLPICQGLLGTSDPLWASLDRVQGLGHDFSQAMGPALCPQTVPLLIRQVKVQRS